MSALLFTATPLLTHTLLELQQSQHKSIDNNKLNELAQLKQYTINDIKYISTQTQNKSGQKPVYIHQLLHDCAVTSPYTAKPIRAVNKQFQQYLAQQRIIQEHRQYRDMMHNKLSNSTSLSMGQSYAELSGELSIGVNVILMMVTGFISAMWCGRQLFPNDIVLPVVCGLAGMIIALLIEIMLFIIRDRKHDIIVKNKEKFRLQELGIQSNIT